MSGPGETTAAGSERPCGLSSLIPIGMSCRGRAEAFARRLQSRLRTLGTQGPTTQGVENDTSENSWLTQTEQQVTSLQPLRHLGSHEADSFFDFDIEPESPGSPADECEYSRLIETTSVTPQDVAPESGYVCASPISPEGSVESQSSSDGPYFDPESSDAEQRSLTGDYYDCIESKKDNTSSISQSSSQSMSTMPNGHLHTIIDSDSCSESLPPSQSTDNNSTCNTAPPSSASNSTLQDDTETTESTVTAIQNGNAIRCLENGVDDERVEEFKEPEIQPDPESVPELDSKSEQEMVPKEEITQMFTSTLHIGTNGELEKSTLEINKHYTLECPHIIEATPEASPEPESIDKSRDETDKCSIKTLESLAVDASEFHNNTKTKEHLSVSMTDVTENDEDEDEVDDDRPQRVRRCSSLKTGKTPPGTPGRKKIVRFADVLGLDLADVRTFMDEIPKIPKSAYEDLEVHEPIVQTLNLGPRPEKVLVPLFQQPAAQPNFLDIVRERQVCLENAAVTDPVSLTITGCVRVRNLDFHKSVHIRYSSDAWRSFSDLQGNYVENSCDGFSDKYSFIMFGNALQVGQRIELAVRFQCKGQQFWDNNYGANYCFQCLPVSTPIKPIKPVSVPEDHWCSGSFY